MAYTTVNIGPNSNLIDVPASWTEVELLDTIEPLMIAAGWTKEGSTTGSSPGDYDYYSCLHNGDVDAGYKKGVAINIDRNGDTLLRLYAGEKPSGTTQFSALNDPIDLTDKGCRLYCFISNTYVILYVRSKDGIKESWAGVCEHTDSLGIPFGTANTDPQSRLCIFSDETMTTDNLNPVRVISAPLVNDGNRETSEAYNYTCVVSNIGLWGTYSQSATGVQLGAGIASIPENTHPTTGKPYVSDMTILVASNSHTTPIGMMYGIKILNKSAGLPLDIVNIKVDANGFCNEGGVDAEHFIITGAGSDHPTVCLAVPK